MTGVQTCALPISEEETEPLEENSLYQELRRGPSLYPVKEEEEDEDEGDEEEDDEEDEETHRLPPLRRPVDEDDEEDDEPTRRIDFNNLKFGKDYEI